ncbi:hypothetical protein HDU91_000128, partial [Kappamyces sp. JEL0680]
VMKGYNGTIFAYGQTGAGKTHTMMGDVESPSLKGLTPRIVERIFDMIVNSSSDLEFTVKVSFMEIYMERVRDLLQPANDNLPVHEDKLKGVYVKGLLEVFVGSVDEVYDVMRRGQLTRAVGSTSMNAESSRSHSIFMIHITQKSTLTGSTKTGKLSLVDLAGSEKAGKTGATGQTLEEAKKINKSLSALGMVINSLTDGRSMHVPYRDSKLTRILQESLGGNSRTTLIINCSPSSFNEQETVSTLRFGVRAKSIKNNAKINTELSSVELKTMLKEAKRNVHLLETQIGLITGEVAIWRQGGTVPTSEWLPLDPRWTKTAADAGVLDGLGRSVRSPSPTLEVSAPFDLEAEKQVFLDRENELEDLVSQKSSEIAELKDKIKSIQAQLQEGLDRELQAHATHKELHSTINQIQMELEKSVFENKEACISLDSLKESNVELETQVEQLKAQIQAMRHDLDQTSKAPRSPETDASISQLLAAMNEMQDKERHMRETIARLEIAKESSRPPTDPSEIASQHYELIDAKVMLLQNSALLQDNQSRLAKSHDDFAMVSTKVKELEKKLAQLEAEYEQLLEQSMQDHCQLLGQEEIAAAIQEARDRLERQYFIKKTALEAEVVDLQTSMAQKDQEIDDLKDLVRQHTEKNQALKDQFELLRTGSEEGMQVAHMRQVMAKQLSEFEKMKQRLARDLQQRASGTGEVVVQHALSHLAEAASEESPASSQKVQFLQKAMDQLTIVQRQLVQQNSQLKKDASTMEKKLATRNDRIGSLESLLRQTQDALDEQEAK